MTSCALICFSSYQIAALQLFHFVSVNRKINALCKYWFTHRYNKDSQIPISFKTLTFGICQCFNDISALNELYWILIHKREGRKYVLKKRLVFQELIMFKCSKTFPTSVKEHGEWAAERKRGVCGAFHQMSSWPQLVVKSISNIHQTADPFLLASFAMFALGLAVSVTFSCKWWGS